MRSRLHLFPPSAERSAGLPSVRACASIDPTMSSELIRLSMYYICMSPKKAKTNHRLKFHVLTVSSIPMTGGRTESRGAVRRRGWHSSETKWNVDEHRGHHEQSLAGPFAPNRSGEGQSQVGPLLQGYIRSRARVSIITINHY